MDTVIWIMIILIAIIVLIVFSINVNQKLSILEDNIKKEWDKLKELENKKFELAVKLVNEQEYDEKVQQITNLITRYSNADSPHYYIDCYIDLTHLISTFKMSEELQNAFNCNKELFDKTRIDYNNLVLNFNSRIKTFPINILAKFLGYSKYIYFRTEE